MVDDLPEALVTGREYQYLNYYFKKLAYNPTSIKEEDVTEYIRQYSIPGALRAGFNYYRTLLDDGQYNQQYNEHKLTMPILAYCGETSTGDYLRQSILSISEHVEGGSILECGHYSRRTTWILN
ncbi:hypothetical protein [Viridibacillus sp. FSL H8-0110]|uniref:hypothetical protein n=1 Tax=Viridibacillus sp. FSL H8-0110 TaxID=2921376 RepID=UPI0030FC85B4